MLGRARPIAFPPLFLPASSRHRHRRGGARASLPSFASQLSSLSLLRRRNKPSLDRYRYRLERMTDELDDLGRRGLFTRAELADVVRRHSPLRQDFLDCIAYEFQLDAPRNLRKRAIIRAAATESEDDHDSEDGANGEKMRRRNKKTTTSSGVLRVLDIYGSATSSSAAANDTAG